MGHVDLESKPIPIIKVILTLTNVAQSVGCHPAKPEVTGSILVQGTRLGMGSVPCQGTYERQLTNISLSYPCFPLFLPPFPSL